ncbi:uncharacterized protein RSE6_09832 [Rhynchosporium secalis]|uniref:Uncharacterized protein n=1 Tax=Rhynchosporium secalis TaxID=38038 RepID=A0A1E1MIW9_RHYSE|nr:uncharacterized protein RSE6_09832 [Rhynchosporium secalis]
MPPKRKALADTSSNKDTATESRNAKAAKTSDESDASKNSAAQSKVEVPRVAETATPATEKGKKSKAQPIKYSKPNTSGRMFNGQTMVISLMMKFIDDENQDMPQDGQLIDEFCYRVSDLGIPLSEEGTKQVQKLDKEYAKRDQDAADMHIYNDWNGWGMSELLENFLKDFNKDVFKKTASPYQKWAYIEGLAVFFFGAEMEMVYWLGNEDGDRVTEIAQIVGTMILTTFDVPKEHDLFKPDSEVVNIGIVSLLMLHLFKQKAMDFDCDWAPEVVRLCDEAGIKLDDIVRKQTESEHAGKNDEGDGYKHFNERKDWTPEDDLDESKCKMWYRWDWKLEYAALVKGGSHPGGKQYDLTKMSKAEKESYTLGTKAFSRRIGI